MSVSLKEDNVNWKLKIKKVISGRLSDLKIFQVYWPQNNFLNYWQKGLLLRPELRDI